MKHGKKNNSVKYPYEFPQGNDKIYRIMAIKNSNVTKKISNVTISYLIPYNYVMHSENDLYTKQLV